MNDSPNTSPVGSSTQLVYLDKCAVCGKPASKKCGGCSLAFYCTAEHQRQHWNEHKENCKPYEVVPLLDTDREDPGGEQQGKGPLCLVALKPIPADTFIISEYPLLSFEKRVEELGLEKILEISGAYPVKCLGCQQNWMGLGGIVEKELGEEGTTWRCQLCGVPICSKRCSLERHQNHCKLLQKLKKKEIRTKDQILQIVEDIQVMQVLEREKAKGTPVNLKRASLSVWSPLLKQVKGIAGPDNLENNYPLSLASTEGSPEGVEVVRLLVNLLQHFSLPMERKIYKRNFVLFEKHCYLTHSCCPNTESFLDHSGVHVKLRCRVIRPILPGERISTFRSQDPTLFYNPTILRRQKLQKQAIPLNPCACFRCQDPSEHGTHLSAIRCTTCNASNSLTCNYLYPVKPLEKRTPWQCSGKQCRVTRTFEQVLVINLKAEKELEAIWKETTVTTATGCELILTRLHNYIVKHQRKILHPENYLILIARSRINKVVSYFLGQGWKLFLCVVADQPRAYDYCGYKVEHLQGHLRMLEKLQNLGNSRVGGKLRYELAFCEGALAFRDFAEERLAGSSFLRRLVVAVENVKKVGKVLGEWEDCAGLVKGVRGWEKMVRELLGADWGKGERIRRMQKSRGEEEGVREMVKRAMDEWKRRAEEKGLERMYMRIGGGEENTEGGWKAEEMEQMVMEVVGQVKNK